MEKRFLVWFVIVLLFLVILLPVITYSSLTSTYDSVLDSYRNNNDNLQQQVYSLTEQNKQLDEEKSQLTNLTQPHLITAVGWYLHKSNDPVESSKNTFTIYGTITNIGTMPANNVEFTVNFNGSNETVLQTSTIHVGVVPSILNSSVPFNMGKYNIDCSMADSVVDIDVSLHYQ